MLKQDYSVPKGLALEIYLVIQTHGLSGFCAA